MAEDRELLQRYATSGTESAFTELVSRHIHWVHSSATRQVGDPDLARDVTQMVFTDLARRADSLPSHVLLGAWLHRATRYAAGQVRRTQQRREARERMHAELNTPEDPSSSGWSAIRADLDEALDRLRDSDREILVLRYFEQRDLRTVGAVLGVSEDTAQKRVSRALERLRALLPRPDAAPGIPALTGLMGTHVVSPSPTSFAPAVANLALGAKLSEAPASGILSLSSSTPVKVASGILLAVAIGIPWMVVHLERRRFQNNIDQLRGIQQQLTAELEVARKRPEPAPSGPPPEVKSELLRLRGEVARLRRQVPVATGRNPPPPSGARPSLADLGTDSPEAAATTAVWAISSASRERLDELLLPDPEISPEQAAQRRDVLFHVMTNAFSRRHITGIQQVRTNDDGSRTVYFDFEDLDTGKPDVVLVNLRASETGWRVDPGKFQYVTEATPDVNRSTSPGP
ncbi:MAG: sigma-70 family RNA polymerase sigma factor [Verrucomicrobiales bacterium]|nr:sigma-70 family RNA polymerase sigma factor [Verrucomicrobiales bacterium]